MEREKNKFNSSCLLGFMAGLFVAAIVFLLMSMASDDHEILVTVSKSSDEPGSTDPVGPVFVNDLDKIKFINDVCLNVILDDFHAPLAGVDPFRYGICSTLPAYTSHFFAMIIMR